MKRNSFKVFKKSEGKFLDFICTPYNCLCNEYAEDDLVFIPFIAVIEGHDLFEGDVVRNEEYDYLAHCVGATYFAVVEFNEKRGKFLFKELGSNEEFELDDYNFDEVIGNRLTNPEFFKEEQEIT